MTSVEFTAHNIRLDDGTLTKPEMERTIEEHSWFISAKRVLSTVFPGDKSTLRLADLGCLEGGYSVGFARMGFQVLGIEVRESNIAASRYVKSKTDLPNLEFVRDDAWNISQYGTFDAVFCCGLFYHLDRPREFLDLLSKVTNKLLILQTHFSTASGGGSSRVKRLFRKVVQPVLGRDHSTTSKYALSDLTENESVPGRWFREFASDAEFHEREKMKAASWDNRRSFWIQREYLIELIYEVGFDLVFEQFDSLAPQIAEAMEHGSYKVDSRGTFVGIKTGVGACGET